MEVEKLHEVFLKHPTISTDSRKISKGCLYFALSGPNFNGNDYAIEALNKGAAYAVVDNKDLPDHPNTILVDNVLLSLQRLGTHHRNYCTATIISLTGSNGKTTTKELIYRVMSQKYETIATQGNLNNHIGVPLSLLSIKQSTEFAIIEMGANHQGEIAELCEIAQPDMGCITNYGKAHMEGFGGVQGIIKGKSELYTYLLKHHKTILYNDQDPIQVEKTKGYKQRLSFGQNSDSHFKTATIDSEKATLSFEFENLIIDTQLYGDYNATNCMIAAAIGAHYAVPLSDIEKAISNYIPNNNRSEIREIGSHQIILDAYNANPSSMTAALKHFAKISTELQKVVILGDMFELGETAIEEHQEIVSLLESLAFDRIILVGKLFAATHHSFESHSTTEAFLNLFTTPKKPTMILIKGSRGMMLEKALNILD